MARGSAKIDAYHTAEAAKAKKKERIAREKAKIGARPFKISKAELVDILMRAEAFVDNPELLARFIKVQAGVILQVDALLGTEAWRMRGTAGMAISAQSRARFLEQSGRLLADIQASSGRKDEPLLLEGVIVAK